MPTIIESPLRPKVRALVNLALAAALSDPAKPTMHGVDRRFFKLYEELGAASQAYLAVTGSTAKQLAYVDLDVELCDVFVAYVNQVLALVRLMFANTEESSVDELRHALTNHLLTCLAKPETQTTGARLARLIRCLSSTHLEAATGLKFLYHSLIFGCEDLFMLMLHDPRPADAAQTGRGRLDVLLAIVERKADK